MMEDLGYYVIRSGSLVKPLAAVIAIESIRPEYLAAVLLILCPFS